MRRPIIIIIVLLIVFAAGKRATQHSYIHDIQYTTTTQTYDTIEECQNDPSMLVCTQEDR